MPRPVDPVTYLHRRSSVPTGRQMDELFERARAAIYKARDVRYEHRRRRSPERLQDVEAVLELLRASSREVGRERNRAAADAKHEMAHGRRLRDASQELRRESRRLQAMRRNT